MFVLRTFLKNGTVTNVEIGCGYSTFYRWQIKNEDTPNEIKNGCFFLDGDDIEAVIWGHGLEKNSAIPLLRGEDYVVLNDNGNVYEKIQIK